MRVMIKTQCPYTGGPAVERARSYIAMINDSMEYFDDDVCLQVGVYRSESASNIISSLHFTNKVTIIPNPAGNQFEIILNSNQEGICKVIIRNSKKQLIYNNKFPCDENSLQVSSDNWAPGVYMISVLIDNSFTEIQKLVIVK